MEELNKAEQARIDDPSIEPWAWVVVNNGDGTYALSPPKQLLLLKERPRPRKEIVMPSVSKAQQRFMGYELNKERETGSNDTGMSEQQLRDFATTKRKGLPERKTKRKARKARK